MFTQNYIAKLAMVSIAALFTAPAFASDTLNSEAAQGIVDEGEDIVVTATGFAQPRSQTGQAISVIDRERLETLQVASVSDALRTIPGVQIAQRGPVGSQTSAFIRGANSSQTLVLIDGVRINDPSSPNAAFDFGALLAGNVGRVEVLRGANSVVWGSQAIGGVVNVQSLIPTSGFAARASAEYGYSDTLNTSANISGSSGILSGSFGGGYYRSDGISALAGGTERDGYRNLSANGRLLVNIAPNISLDLRGYYNNGRIAYDSPFGAGANALPVSRNRQFLGYVGGNVTLADGRWKNRIAYTRTDINRLGTDPVVFSFNNFDVAGTVNRFEYHSAFDLMPSATLVFGIEHERTVARVSFEGAVPSRARNRVTSGFVQAIVRPLAGLAVTGGVRQDDYSDYGGQTVMSGNIAYSPNDGSTTVRAAYGEGFRAPTLSEGQPPFGNPNLRPETARNFDVGVEQALLDDRVRLSATYFNRRSTDLIAFSFVTFSSENIDRVDSEGVELSLALRPTATLDIQANYTLTDAINRSAGANFGKRLALRPRDSASVTVDWRSPLGIALGTTILMIGDSFDNPSNSVRLDGYALVALRASVPLTEKVELFGRVDNLFDVSYQSVARFNTYPQSAYVGVRARF